MSEPILGAGDRLGHVHTADNNRFQPGAGCLDFQPTFTALKQIGYDGFVSIECSALGGPALKKGADAALAESVDFLRTQWNRA